jgi:hypothetical protein
MVRQAHHDRLDLPLVPSIKLRTGSELVKGFAPFKTLNSEMQPGQNWRLLYWICRRSDKGRGRARIEAVIVARVRGGAFTF